MEACKLILIDPAKPICQAWEKEFDSLGQMDGGVDLALSVYFGEQLQQNVQKKIIEEYPGEQPVGTCMIVETGNSRHPCLAHTPTMRVPVPISRTDNVYSAMWAMLVAVHEFSGMTSVS